MRKNKLKESYQFSILFLMGRMIFWMLTFIVLNPASMKAQVTIGTDMDPHSGAVLDLQSTTHGLKFPNVSINNVNVFGLPLSGISTLAKAKGMVVYNTNTNIGEGLYVWNGSKWLPVISGAAIPPDKIVVTDFTLPSFETIDVGTITTINVTDFQPLNSSYQSVNWSIVSGSDYGKITESTATGCTIEGIASGICRIRAVSIDNQITRYCDVAVAITSGAGETIYGENGVYQTYIFPDNIGYWMITNSKEGEYSAKSYPGYENYDRGYYYSWDQAANACPSGWVLPTWQQCANLRAYMGNYQERWRDIFLPDQSSLGGMYMKNTNWIEWNMICAIWTSTQGTQWGYRRDMTFGWNAFPVGYEVFASVRCVKNW
jgi:uncharacterized protein (TIGR02145 family)